MDAGSAQGRQLADEEILGGETSGQETMTRTTFNADTAEIAEKCFLGVLSALCVDRRGYC
jgi:hypothetical protein